MELHELILFIVLNLFFGYLLLLLVACLLEEANKKRKKRIKIIRGEVEKLLLLKKEKKKVEKELKVKITNLHKKNKDLRKLLHEARREKNLLKKGKKCI